MTDKLIKSVSKELDNLVPFDKWIPGLPGKLAEMGDGYVFSLALQAFHNTKYNDLSPDVQEKITLVLQAFVDRDLSGVEAEVIDEVLEAINLGDDEELLISDVVKAVFSYIKRKIEKA